MDKVPQLFEPAEVVLNYSESEIIQMVPVDMIKIDLPLFKKGSHPINYIIEYVLSKYRNSRLTIVPPREGIYEAHGLNESEISNGIPGIIESKVYQALIILLQMRQKEQNNPIFPTQLITNVNEISKYAKIIPSRKDILKAIINLQNTTYIFENSYYSGENKAIEEKITASILVDFRIIKYEDMTNTNEYYQ